MSNNLNIASTRISPLIRVSSAAIWYDHENRYQVVTFVFSDSQEQRTRQFIHGSTCGEDGIDELTKYAQTFHRRIVLKLRKRFF